LENKCIECESSLKRIKFPKEKEKTTIKKTTTTMKCLNRNCSLSYVLTEVMTYDISRWESRGRNIMKDIIKDGDAQVFFFFYLNILTLLFRKIFLILFVHHVIQVHFLIIMRGKITFFQIEREHVKIAV
jgi:hypothetical protein